MTNTADKLHERNLRRMFRQLQVAESLGFVVIPDSAPVTLLHATRLARLVVTDDETGWKIILFGRKDSPIAPGGSYLIETGSIALNNLTTRQFTAVLYGLAALFDDVATGGPPTVFV
jgi:hypothetical protein